MLGFHPIAAMPLASGHVFVYVATTVATPYDYIVRFRHKGGR